MMFSKQNHFSYPSGGIEEVFVKDWRSRMDYSCLAGFEGCTRPTHGWAMKYVATGSELYAGHGHEWEVGPGQFLLLNNDTSFECAVPDAGFTTGLCTYLSWEDIQEAWRHKLGGDAGQLEGEEMMRLLNEVPEWVFPAQASSLGRLAAELTAQGEKRFLLDPQALHMRVLDAAADHLLELHQQIPRIASVKRTTQEELYRRVLRAIAMIHDGLAQPLSVADLAQEACLSEYHFFRVFKQCLGVTPQRYIEHQRLSLAKSLLHQDKLSVTEVALRCGYDNVHYFSNRFKLHFGIRPTQFRMQMSSQTQIWLGKDVA